jgi:hypothetical protein
LDSNPTRTERVDINLAFDGVTPLTRVQMLGKPLEFVLDTGNQGGTQLWERFARDFPDVASKGARAPGSYIRSAARRNERLS